MGKNDVRAKMASEVKRLARFQGRILVREIVKGVGGVGWLLDGVRFATLLEVRAELLKK